MSILSSLVTQSDGRNLFSLAILEKTQCRIRRSRFVDRVGYWEFVGWVDFVYLCLRYQQRKGRKNIWKLSTLSQIMKRLNHKSLWLLKVRHLNGHSKLSVHNHLDVCLYCKDRCRVCWVGSIPTDAERAHARQRTSVGIRGSFLASSGSTKKFALLLLLLFIDPSLNILLRFFVLHFQILWMRSRAGQTFCIPFKTLASECSITIWILSPPSNTLDRPSSNNPVATSSRTPDHQREILTRLG